MAWRLDHVQLAIPSGSEERCDGFYVGLLGFVIEPKPPSLAVRGGRWYRHGDAVLHLGVTIDFHPATKAHPALCCEEYPALLERLRAAGYEVREDREIDGVARCYVDDPVGNRLELIDASSSSRH